MDDILIPLGVNTLVQLARDPKRRGKWRKALLKIFIAIAIAFKDDAEFAQAHDAAVLKQ